MPARMPLPAAYGPERLCPPPIFNSSAVLLTQLLDFYMFELLLLSSAKKNHMELKLVARSWTLRSGWRNAFRDRMPQGAAFERPWMA